MNEHNEKKIERTTAVSRNGWFYFSQPEITQREIYIYLQLSIKQVATTQSRGTLYAIFKPARKFNNLMQHF